MCPLNGEIFSHEFIFMSLVIKLYTFIEAYCSAEVEETIKSDYHYNEDIIVVLALINGHDKAVAL